MYLTSSFPIGFVLFLFFSLFFSNKSNCQIIDSINQIDYIDFAIIAEKVDKELSQMRDYKAIKKYWLSIDEKDQEYRGLKSSFKNDLTNAIKVYKLIQKFGYPSIKDFGEEVNYVPFLVYVHQGQQGTRERLFPLYYQAWKKGLIDDTQMGTIVCGIPCVEARKIHKGEGLPKPHQLDTLISRCNFNLKEVDTLSVWEVAEKVVEEYMEKEKKNKIIQKWSSKNGRHTWVLFERNGMKFIKKISHEPSFYFGEEEVVSTKTTLGVRYDYVQYQYGSYFIVDNSESLHIISGIKIREKKLPVQIAQPSGQSGAPIPSSKKQ